jgi:predicted nucleotidyltransferase
MVNKKTIQQAAALLSEKFHPDRIILFGSYARGTADRHSDVDLLVIAEAVSGKNRVKLMSEMSGEIDKLSFPKDIVVLTPEEFEVDKDIPGTIARYAAKEGKLLYERKEKRRRKESERMAFARR